MASFIARVELHGASYSDYEVLHAEMARRGFARTILGNDGNRYQLPTGEYCGNGDVSDNVALEEAKAAADVTGKASSIIVARWTSAAWIGLSTV